MAYAQRLLEKAGNDVSWDDGITEFIAYMNYRRLGGIRLSKPDDFKVNDGVSWRAKTVILTASLTAKYEEYNRGTPTFMSIDESDGTDLLIELPRPNPNPSKVLIGYWNDVYFPKMDNAFQEEGLRFDILTLLKWTVKNSIMCSQDIQIYWSAR